MNSNKSRKAELYTVEAIRTLDKEYVEDGSSTHFPKVLKNLTGRPFTFKLEIATANIGNHGAFYWATNVCNGFKTEAARQELQQTTTEDTQATTSTFHQPSDLNAESSAVTKD
ncbi:hypothetical protein DCAR_0417661 [Daucus carota subsp. sativus]|uniref:Uncharacterized protein n=1 Tax=Daucus carota subsp. sativus TaxID=79200 RepID=A0A162ADL0_DAUCS|nr:hypothetical protein DCAR_0417661 [Daucus carota subsp. sativus]